MDCKLIKLRFPALSWRIEMGSHFETPLLAKALGRLFPSRVEKVESSHTFTPLRLTLRKVTFTLVYVELKIFRSLSLII